jgi:hypothetical protein
MSSQSSYLSTLKQRMTILWLWDYSINSEAKHLEKESVSVDIIILKTIGNQFFTLVRVIF